MSCISDTSEWKKLVRHHQAIGRADMREWFADDPEERQQFSDSSENIFVDYSKNRITRTTLDLLFDLARVADVQAWRARLFNGEVVNQCGQRPAVHPMYRGSGADFASSTAIRSAQSEMLDLAEAIRSGVRVGHSGRAFTDVVHIGIGGSCIGPFLACSALQHLKHKNINIHFISGCDPVQIQETLMNLSPETTLFLLVSKSFTTPETLLNGRYAKEWIHQHYRDNKAWEKHFIGVSANKRETQRFGFAEENCCFISEDVGGRYSVWSAAALSLAIGIGKKHFEDFLAGAASMDKHFLERDAEHNLPMLLGLLGVWYASFFGIASRAVLAYDYVLRELPIYVQQLEMESTGKSATRDGEACDYATAPVVWGGLGLDGQHSFYQMLHQGTQIVPADFILSEQSPAPLPEHNTMVRANYIAQMRALMIGGSDGKGTANTGNQPSNAILLKTISPYVLGELLAMYEHRTFTQAVVWQINPFDQGGVELGKRIATELTPRIQGDDADNGDLDVSTAQLIKRLGVRGD